MTAEINIGLLGFGTVGKSVFELIQKNGSWISKKAETPICFKKICVRDLSKDRGVDSSLLTTDYKDVVNDPEIQVVVELFGDSEEALDAIRTALSNGKCVVTANKALLARHALEFFDLAEKNNCEIMFEASVAAALPVLRTIKETLAGNQLSAVYGIINGTSNYILTKMTEENAEFDDVLKEAQDLGYAEADPSSDVDGDDAAYKLAILAMLCHGKYVAVDDVFCRGIRFIKPLDIHMADQFGYVIKLLGITKVHDDEFDVRVHPTMIPKNSPLASVNGAFNAVLYEGDYAGRGMLYGLGAGGKPTASSVASDLIEVVRRLSSRNQVSLPPSGFSTESLQVVKPKGITELRTRYYIRFSVLDRPNVLAAITSILGQHNISIQHLYQHGEKEESALPIIVFTHEACEKDVRTALKEIDSKDFITQMTKIIRIEDEEEAA